MIMSTFTLSAIEVKVLNKLGLKKEDVFAPKREDAKEDLDAVSYISIKWYLDTPQWNEVLSMSIFEATNNIAFFTYNKSTKKRTQVLSAEFRTMINSLSEYKGSESIDDM